MQLEHSFTVPVDVDTAWEVLLDIERVAPCMPGAVLDSVDGDSFTGRVKIKLGPVNLTYKGSASFVDKDAEAHRVVIDANGKDARGNGTAAAKVTATLVAAGESTEVKVLTDLNITGKPAQFGRGVMVDVGNKLIGQFATCLQGKIGGGPEQEVPAEDSRVPQHSAESAEPAPAPASAPAAGPSTSELPTSELPTAELPAAAVPAPVPSAAATPSAGPPISELPTAEMSATEPPAAAVPAPVPPAATGPASAPAPSPIRPAAAEPEPIDLLELAGGSMLTRVAAPVAGVALVVAVLVWLLRRRGR